jgi:hypothetical protein
MDVGAMGNEIEHSVNFSYPCASSAAGAFARSWTQESVRLQIKLPSASLTLYNTGGKTIAIGKTLKYWW